MTISKEIMYLNDLMVTPIFIIALIMGPACLITIINTIFGRNNFENIWLICIPTGLAIYFMIFFYLIVATIDMLHEKVTTHI